MRFAVAFIVAIVWCAWLLASATAIDAGLVGHTTEFTLGAINGFASIGVVALLIGIVSREISL